MKTTCRRLLSILLVGFVCGMLLWHCFTYSIFLDIKRSPASKNFSTPSRNSLSPRSATVISSRQKIKQIPVNSKQNAIIDIILANYSYNWKKHNKNVKSFRSLVSNKCNGILNAVITQINAPLGSSITYDAERKRTMVVKEDLFNIFPKETPFKKAPWDTCAVIGNGGILANSSCGKQINSATYVIRCNLPPLNNGHERDTGSKTNLVTANPSILFQKYRSLNERRRPFVKDTQLYGDAMLILPAFSYGQNTAVSLRALYSLEDIKDSSVRAAFFNPKYLKCLAEFWRDHKIKSARLSTGIMMTTLALELCNTVHLYGFWPFEIHPHTRQTLTNHYYDNKPVNSKVHAMPLEFDALLKLHNTGVINLHLWHCDD